jgi:WD40 repeat protein
MFRKLVVIGTSNSKNLIYTDNECSLRVYDRFTGRVRNLSGHKEYVLCLGLSYDDHYLSSGSGEGALKVWDLEAGVEVSNLVDYEATRLSIAFIAGNEKVVSGSYDRTFRISDLRRNNRDDSKSLILRTGIKLLNDLG